ncbi:hypothetical protein LguiA_003105 [Lonicera macranthoides]
MELCVAGSASVAMPRKLDSSSANVAIRAGADVDVATMGINNFNPKVWGQL